MKNGFSQSHSEKDENPWTFFALSPLCSLIYIYLHRYAFIASVESYRIFQRNNSNTQPVIRASVDKVKERMASRNKNQ